MATETQEVGRLALRVEGRMWNAYYALPNTMDGAIHLGGIAMAAVEENMARKGAFMDLMRDFVADIIEDRTGTRPGWNGERCAPEHERAGNA